MTAGKIHRRDAESAEGAQRKVEIRMLLSVSTPVGVFARTRGTSSKNERGDDESG
jgi:hypothetical protein